MSELQTYKGANWVDVKDSDELVIYDTSKPTVIREADDGMYHLTFRIKNMDDDAEEEISDVCGTVTPQEVAVPKGSIIGEPEPSEDEKSLTIPFLFNDEVVATVEATSIPDTAQYGYWCDLGDIEEGLIGEGGVIQKDGWIEVVFSRVGKVPLTIEVNNSEYGTVSSNLINVVVDSNVKIVDNQIICFPDTPKEQIVTATPNSGYLFQGWSIDGVTVSGWQPISEATTIVANFVAEPTLLTYSELKALGTAEAILAELNKDDEGYYASLTAEGHIYEQSPQEGTTVAVLAEVVGEDQQSSTPLLVDGGLFMYMVEGTPGEGLSLHTWYTMPVGN